MSLYAIGDVQGCYDELQRLLDGIRFDPVSDRLWFTGDLVNRGPRSLDVLRLVVSLGDRAVSVLGNHDLHLLAVAAGARPLSPQDTFQDVLGASDRAELIEWLRAQPLLRKDIELGCLLVHAGLLPQWDAGTAEACAREAEAAIRGSRCGELLCHMYGDKPDLWNDELAGWDRLRLIVNAFTRLRFCDVRGRADYRHKGAPGSQAPHLVPWFAVPGRLTRGERIVFGHWSLLGFWDKDGVLGLDTGCVWGGRLTAVRLERDRHEIVSVHCRGSR
jgi:bis(5'-nucleosyl)-tetraphosphatase (symmetrical)